MVKSLRQHHVSRANPAEFEASDLSEPTLQEADQWYTIYDQQANQTTTYGAGFGVGDTRRNTGGWADLDLQTSTPGPISGSLRYRVYRDSSKEELVAQSGKYSLNALRSAVSAARKDKVLIPGMVSTVPRPDGYMTVEVSPNASSVGDAVSASDSSTDLGIPYSELAFR